MAPRRPGRQGGGGGRHGSRGLWVHRSAQTQPVWRGVVRRGGANTGPGRHPPLPPASHSGRPGKVRGPVPAGRRQVHRGGDSSRPVLTLVQKSPPCGGGLGGGLCSACATSSEPYRKPPELVLTCSWHTEEGPGLRRKCPPRVHAPWATAQDTIRPVPAGPEDAAPARGEPRGSLPLISCFGPQEPAGWTGA